ncbi:MAG: alpha/beta hydrolase, partial [Gemmatimonadota bacterium]|nr:alpha/beta hydrolase [Gemmatimonadota bacterium]
QQRPQRYGGVVVYSGGLIGPPGTTWSTDGSFDGTPVFFGCSNIDFHIPEKRVRDSAEHFARMGADVAMRIYEDMGHLVNDDEIAFTNALLAGLARS